MEHTAPKPVAVGRVSVGRLVLAGVLAAATNVGLLTRLVRKE